MGGNNSNHEGRASKIADGDHAGAVEREPLDGADDCLDEAEEEIAELQDRLARSRTVKEVLRTAREMFAGPNAPKIVETVMTQLGRYKDRESQAKERIARSYTLASHVSNAVFVVSLILCLVFLGWVIQSLKDNKDLLLPVLSAVISLIAGAGGGWIFGRNSVPRNPD